MNDNHYSGAYYQPPQINQNYYSEPPKKNGWKIVLIIVAVILALSIAIGAVGFVTYGFIKYLRIGGESLTVTSSECSYLGSDVNEINIDWVEGDISISYCDDEQITITESCEKSTMPMVCTLGDDGELSIDYIDYNNISRHDYHHITKVKKDLVITIPYSTQLSEVEINVVASDVTMSDIACNKFEFSTVGGNGSFTFKTQPKKIELDSVGGNVEIGFANDISGYALNTSTVSGTITDEIDNYGDGGTKIEFSSVGGDLRIFTAE